MAGSTATKTDLKELLGISGMEQTEDATVLKSNKGRQVGADVLFLRETLQDSMKSQKAVVFKGVDDGEQRDTLVRKIRSAASTAGPNGTRVKISTSYDGDKKILYWGPKEVIDVLTGRKAKTSEQSANSNAA